jgi:hypothetical protein
MGDRRRALGELVSSANGQRERVIRAAFEGVGDELLDLDTTKSGSVTVHFQNGIPMKVEWRMLARPVKHAGLASEYDR